MKTQMAVAISLILLLAGVWVIVSARYDVAQKHWAYATLGVIIGYWLR